MKTNWKNKKKEIADFIMKQRPEFFWDYRDELLDEQISKIVSEENGMDDVRIELWENNLEYICELEDILISDVIKKFSLDEKYLDDEFSAFCQDYISIDINLDGLIYNTQSQVFFYDLDTEITGEDIERDLAVVKKRIGLQSSEEDGIIREMLQDAYYGGNLVAYFMADIMSLIKPEDSGIRFQQVNLAIVDHCNGSGGDCFIKGADFIVPFERDKIVFDKSIKYNYSFSVCGMCSDWCEDTQWGFAKWYGDGKTSEEKTAIQIRREYDTKCDSIFKAGGCSVGDMDMKRHRNIEYVNDFPCGWHCKDCGTFWVD